MNPLDTSRMRPSDISQLITGHHEALGAKCAELSRIAKTLKESGPSVLARVVRMSLRLCEVVAANIRVEREVLLPALRDLDAWGKSRAESLLGRLGARSAGIDELRASCSHPHRADLGDAVDRFVEERQSGMQDTRHKDLSVLRDDVIAIDSHGG